MPLETECKLFPFQIRLKLKYSTVNNVHILPFENIVDI